jgi:transcriptional regulator with XRE-family HTH domain
MLVLRSAIVSDEPQRLAVVLGRRCREIRTEIGARQDDLAAAARVVGLRWTGAKVSDFEAGRWTSSFETVLAVSLSLELAASAAGKDRPVTLADLIGDEGTIELTEEVTMSASALSKVCRGSPWEKSMDEPKGVEGVLARSGLAEDRLAKRLNITRELLAQTSWRLWQRSFSEERDLRSGADANAQLRGQVSRSLQAEIEKKLHGSDQ